MTFAVVGIKYRKDAYRKAQVAEGDKLELTPEPTNEFDPNAVAVSKNGIMFGYVPRLFNLQVLALLRQVPVDCRVDKAYAKGCHVTVEPLAVT